MDVRITFINTNKPDEVQERIVRAEEVENVLDVLAQRPHYTDIKIVG